MEALDTDGKQRHSQARTTFQPLYTASGAHLGGTVPAGAAGAARLARLAWVGRNGRILWDPSGIMRSHDTPAAAS
jgi:hypothetical protein